MRMTWPASDWRACSSWNWVAVDQPEANSWQSLQVSADERSCSYVSGFAEMANLVSEVAATASTSATQNGQRSASSMVIAECGVRDDWADPKLVWWGKQSASSGDAPSTSPVVERGWRAGFRVRSVEPGNHLLLTGSIARPAARIPQNTTSRAGLLLCPFMNFFTSCRRLHHFAFIIHKIDNTKESQKTG
jgi:hypothetical protein